jgi:hypothetical protein
MSRFSAWKISSLPRPDLALEAAAVKSSDLPESHFVRPLTLDFPAMAAELENETRT